MALKCSPYVVLIQKCVMQILFSLPFISSANCVLRFVSLALFNVYQFCISHYTVLCIFFTVFCKDVFFRNYTVFPCSLLRI
jgi:hypothetical protein